MSNEYTLPTFVKPGVSRRGRYYIAHSLLPSPTQQGPSAPLGRAPAPSARDQEAPVRALYRWPRSASSWSGAWRTSSQRSLNRRPICGLLTDSALDYIENILHGRRAIIAPEPAPPSRWHPSPHLAAATAPGSAAAPAPATAPGSVAAPLPAALRAFAPTPVALAARPAAPTPEQAKSRSTEPDRAQWESASCSTRTSSAHIRRPLTRHQNKNVERLISIARQPILDE